MDKERLVILDLEDTIGQVYRKNISLRPGALESLKRLSQNSNIVLASVADQEIVSYPIQYFKKHGFKFDGVYDGSKIIPKFPENFIIQPFKDLSAIYRDFNVSLENIERKVIVVEDLQLSHKEIDEKQGEKLLYDNSTHTYHTYGNPLPYRGKVPITILLPGITYQRDSQIVEMTVLPDIIDELFRLGGKDFLSGFELFNRVGIKKLETTMFRKNKENFKRVYAQSEVLDNPFMKRLFGEFTHRYLIIQGNQFPTQKYLHIIMEQ